MPFGHQGVLIFTPLKIEKSGRKKERPSSRGPTHFVAAALQKPPTRALELSSRASIGGVSRASLAVCRRVSSGTAVAPGCALGPEGVFIYSPLKIRP